MSDQHSTARIALKTYIESARKLKIYGGEAGWNENRWVTETLRQLVPMVFCELRKHGRFQPVMMKQPFLDFAKAYVRHKQHQKEVGSIGDTMNALRFVYAALIDIHGKADALQIDGAVQESVREKISAWYGNKQKCYFVSLALMTFYAALRETGIHPALPHWQSPWAQGLDKSRSMDPKAVTWRKNKTPDDQKLAAVLVAFELAETGKDRYWSSLALLLAFSSSRWEELLDLGIDSLIDEDYTDKYGRTRRRVGLRWFSVKGFGANIKWVPRLPSSNGDEKRETELMDKVVQAFKQLLQLSEPARKVAKLAYDTDGAVYPVHEFCVTPADYPQDRVLTDLETVHAMGRTSNLKREGTEIWESYRAQKKYFAWQFSCVKNGNPTYGEIAQVDYQNFSSKLPHWPHTSNTERIKIWECLILKQWNQFNDSSDTRVYPNSYGLPTAVQMNVQLSGNRVKGRQVQIGLFERLGLTMEDGSPIEMTSHDFRRWHGTRGRALAHKGLSEHRLRMLAGRKDVTQNDAYDFNTPEQRADLFRQIQIIASSSDLPAMHERIAVGTPIYRHELLNRELGEHEVLQPVQMGESGGCTHSLTAPPCMKGGDCLPCSEKKYVKDNSGVLQRMRETAAHHKAEFDALDAWQKQREQFGVDQWMTYHVTRYAVAESLVRQLEDPAIPDGAVLGVEEHFDPSPLKVNLMAKGIEVPDQQDRVAQEIDQLLGVLEDA